MADTITLQRWAAPWNAADDAELIEAYDVHEFPTAGVIRQHDVEYLFHCLAGHLEPGSLWIYTCLHESDRKELEDLASGEEFREALARLATLGPAVVAVASRESGILGWSVTDDPSDIQGTVDHIIEDVDAFFEEQRRRARGVHDLAAAG